MQARFPKHTPDELDVATGNVAWDLALVGCTELQLVRCMGLVDAATGNEARGLVVCCANACLCSWAAMCPSAAMWQWLHGGSDGGAGVAGGGDCRTGEDDRYIVCR